MNFDGFLPHEVGRFSSLVEQDDATNLPLGVSPLARNVKFHLTSVRTRDGIQNLYGFTLPDGGVVTGLTCGKIGGNPDIQVPLAFSALGDLYKEFPAGSGTIVKIAGPLVNLPVGASMQAANAFNNSYLAFSDLKNSLASPAVYNLSLGTLDPLSMKLVGQLWTRNTQYQVGECVCPASPVGGNGHLYRCTVAGVSGGAQPVFPAGEQATVVDGGVTWQENTPVLAQALPEPPIPIVTRNAGAGAFAASRDVYIIVTLVNGVGETDAQSALAFKFVNTTLNDQFAVTSPTLALWVQALSAPYAVTGYNVYEADVATGGGAPALSAYKKVNVGAVAIGTTTNVNTTGAGAAPPTTNGALVVPVGNICAGLRYMVVLFVNRNGYISGMTQAAVVSYNGSTNGFQLYAAHIPTGPSNTIARICAITPAGQLSQLAGTGISNAGPYFWIEPSAQFFTSGSFNLSSAPAGVSIADVVNGVQELTTIINDNVSTTATFNFDDNYLKSTLNDVSAYFRKIQVPNCSDVFYSKTLRRMFYASDILKSGWHISLQDDPESVYGDTGLVQVAENNGENRTAVREFAGVIYLMKEKSGHVLTPDPDDPSAWKAVEQWTGSGPCGPRAVDVCTNFMAYVHRSGFYIFEGNQPYRVSKELPVTWASINWAAQQNIWVLIDDETREIRVGVPTGQSTVPNAVIKLNYEELPAWSPPSFAPPIHFSPYIGKEIAAGASYKWSVDDIAANLAIRAERKLTMQLPPSFDLPTSQSQILYASANADGAVSAIVPYIFDDNGAGIDSQYETAAPQDLLRPNRLGGVQANIDGYGQIGIYVLSLRAKDSKQGGISPPPSGGPPAANVGTEIKLKDCQAGVPYSSGGRLTNERLRLRVTNNKRAGTWFDLKWASIYAAPVTSARAR